MVVYVCLNIRYPRLYPFGIRSFTIVISENFQRGDPIVLKFTFADKSKTVSFFLIRPRVSSQPFDICVQFIQNTQNIFNLVLRKLKSY